MLPALLLASLADDNAALAGGDTPRPVCWVVESAHYAEMLTPQAPTWSVVWCGANGSLCASRTSVEVAAVRAVVGRADALNLSMFPALALVQSASWYPVDGEAVPAHSAIANFDIWPAPWFKNYSVANIGEWVVAAVFADTYRLHSRASQFVGCAFAADAPERCPAASSATSHKTVASLTVGILGYGRIGEQIAIRMAALGARVIATQLHGPFEPPPAPLAWLSADNDRLLREADVVVVTVPGSVAGLINQTSLALLKENALLVPISAGPVDFPALERALSARPALRAVLDVWPAGCWGDEDAKCGPPYGPRDWPASPSIAALPNALSLPGMSMRDERFWRESAALAASNLEALAAGNPIQHLVRNATGVSPRQ